MNYASLPSASRFAFVLNCFFPPVDSLPCTTPFPQQGPGESFVVSVEMAEAPMENSAPAVCV